MRQLKIADIEPGETVHRALPGGGVMHMEPGLPYLLVYRQPDDRDDAGTERFVSAEAAHLIAGSGDEVSTLVREVAEAGSEKHGAFLVLEICSAADPRSQSFVIRAPKGPAPETVGKLREEVEVVAALSPGVDVRLDHGDERHPPGLPPLMSISESWHREVLLIGLEVPPVYRNPASGEVFPRFLRRLQRALSKALRQALYEFVRVQTNSHVVNPLALGTHEIPRAAFDVDEKLCDIERSFDLLLLTSPVNAAEAWECFQDDGFDRNPEFHYRLLPVDPDLLKRRLFDIELEKIDDPAIADLFEEKRQELATQFTMLRERETRNFRYSSQRLYGTVDDGLAETARRVLEEVSPPGPWEGEWVDATQFHTAAMAELDFYRDQFGDIDNTIEVRPDVGGLLVSRGNLMIGEDLRIPADRLKPLINHEVGTHVVTFINGKIQPFEQLSLGLAGYDEFQEGLAVLSEYLVGGLDAFRLRLLAARALAAESVQQGCDFVETFRLLTREIGYSNHGAWNITLRVHAAGGSMRDMIYLRGLLDVIDLLRSGAELDPVYTGKIARRHLPVMDELRYRDLLLPPPLTPRYLLDENARARLEKVRAGIPLSEMICP